MFPSPTVIEAERFALLPPALRLAEPVDRHGVRRDNLLEGPSFTRAGDLLCVDLLNSRILSVDRGGRFSVALQYRGNPNGLKIHRDGTVFVADRDGLLVADLAAGTIEPRLPRAFGEPFRGLNDLFFAANGDLYFTDQGQSAMDKPDGRLFCLRADGRLQLLLDNLPSPNGLVLTPDDANLYVAVTRANAVWRVPQNLYPGGEAGRVGVYIHLSGGTGPDGMAISDEGHLVVAHIGMGAVWVFDPLGVPVARVAVGGRSVTNVAFDPAEPDTIYITEIDTGAIYRARIPCRGRAMYSHQEHA
ncbi:SMP-30/gluconolactonase/LRE family protein [Pigmentiphaga soli]|uniref:SMP-30/gluconolactonase/LRE family protein n=1 Tax=Pigmentiphaga soli TaxID=1007095 RepID=A0ABP8HEZ3_9BURK